LLTHKEHRVSVTTVPGSPPALWLGTTYHPSDWREERWPEDIALMSDAGINLVRVADGAWTALEPVEGQFRFEWLDRFLALLGESEIAAMLVIPTSAPPRWMTHPTHGWCVNSSEYRAAARRLADKLVAHFATSKRVAGWELGGPPASTCDCPSCQALFRQYLAERHGTPDELNRRLRASDWNPQYQTWAQITLPVRENHPELELEFRRFNTQNHLRLQELLIEVIRPKLGPGVWLTQILSAGEEAYDPYRLAENVDVSASVCTGSGRHDYRKTGSAANMSRGLKRRNFLVVRNFAPRAEQSRPRSLPFKDETHALAWQAIALGADGLLCWPWRAAPTGAEPTREDCLVDQSGQPRPVYDEIKLLGLEFNALSTWLGGSTTAKARIAILNSHDARWASRADRDHDDFDYLEHLEHWYRPLAARNMPVDIVPPDASLDPFKMVIAPGLSVLSDEVAASLQELVRHSGHLVLALKTGTYDEYGALVPLRQPGPLSKIAGVEVEDVYYLEDPVPVKGNWFEGVSRRRAERLRILDPNKAVKIARYGASNGWLDDEVAVTVCALGTGLTYTVGVYLDAAAQQAMVDHFLQNAGLQKLDTPPGVEINTRTSRGGQQVYVVVNHERSPTTVTLPSPAENPLTGQPVTGPFRLASYGVAVLVKSNQSPTSPGT
jgi:beta-galactosidase